MNTRGPLLTRFFFGFFTYFGGLKTWMKHGALLRISIAPFFLDLICLVGGLYYTVTHVSTIVARFAHAPVFWYQYPLYFAIYAVTALSLFFVVLFAVFIFANLIVFPFNDRLAERTLSIHGVAPDGPRGARHWVGKSLRNTAAMLEKLAIIVGVGSLLALGTLFIPGFGLLAAAAGVLLMACDRMDYAFDQYRMSFRERLGFLRRNFPEVVGFSAGLGLTAALPGLNLLLMPGGVVCGASLVAKLGARVPGPDSTGTKDAGLTLT